MEKHDIIMYDPIQCMGHSCFQPATDIHELKGGMSSNKSGDRQTCIKYHIQALLCRSCHDRAEKSKKFSFDFYCEKMGISPEEVRHALELHDEKKLTEISEDIRTYYYEKKNIVLKSVIDYNNL